MSTAGAVVALVDSQQVAWATGFGYADLEQQIPAQPDTVYRIGSVSKMFATVALMQLAGKVSSVWMQRWPACCRVLPSGAAILGWRPPIPLLPDTWSTITPACPAI